MVHSFLQEVTSIGISKAVNDVKENTDNPQTNWPEMEIKLYSN